MESPVIFFSKVAERKLDSIPLPFRKQLDKSISDLATEVANGDLDKEKVVRLNDRLYSWKASRLIRVIFAIRKSNVLITDINLHPIVLLYHEILKKDPQFNPETFDLSDWMMESQENRAVISDLLTKYDKNQERRYWIFFSFQMGAFLAGSIIAVYHRDKPTPYIIAIVLLLLSVSTWAAWHNRR